MEVRHLRYFVAVEAADHFYNAARVVASGAGRPITHADATPASVSGEIDLLLEDERYRDAAAAIAAEIAAMPSARDAPPALTALADQGKSERGKA
jgi:UDP:flavonoid glycosyltransferase YjiC (YdhE family)